MTDESNPTYETPMEAWYSMTERLSGQSLIMADDALEMLALLEPLYGDETPETAQDYEPTSETYKLSQAVHESAVAVEESRSIVDAWPHQRVIGVHEVSRILAERHDIEPGAQGQYAGRGFSADAEHEGTVAALRDVTPEWVTEWEPDETDEGAEPEAEA